MLKLLQIYCKTSIRSSAIFLPLLVQAGFQAQRMTSDVLE